MLRKLINESFIYNSTNGTFIFDFSKVSLQHRFHTSGKNINMCRQSFKNLKVEELLIIP